MPTFY
ncbi:hypothetical protein N499_0465A, partial [Wolbachia pipientis wVitA]